MMQNTNRGGLLSVVSFAGLLQLGCATTGLPAGSSAASDAVTVSRTPSGIGKPYPADLTEVLTRAAHDGFGLTTADSMPIPLVICDDRAKSTRILRRLSCEASETSVFTFDPSASLEDARKFFYDTCPSITRCAEWRDRVQDRLIMASNAACADYLADVRRSFTGTNLNLGAMTTLFGGLGAVLTGARDTRNFSAAAAATSGLRAEYNDVYFSSQAFELISKAIRSLREKTHKRMLEYRYQRDIRAYTLEGAVGDVLNYHASCSVMAGLEEATDSVTRDRDPGLKRLSELLGDVGSAASVALGTAVLDTSNLPSARRQCDELSGVVGEVRAEEEKLSKAARTETDPTKQQKLQAATAKVTSLLAKVKALEAGAGPCSSSGRVAKEEEDAMYKLVQDFNAAPIQARSALKLQFEAARARVRATADAVRTRVAEAYGLLSEVRSVAAVASA